MSINNIIFNYLTTPDIIPMVDNKNKIHRLQFTIKFSVNGLGFDRKQINTYRNHR